MIDENIKVIKEELKIKLGSEILELKEELSKISVVDPHAPDGYSAKETNTENDVLDDGDQASEMENIHTNDIIMKVLIERKKEVEDALKRMEDGKYGVCEVCKKEISNKRLLILPSAKTCREHMEIE